MADEQFFDLNVQKVLDHWTVAHAVRELLANALDEHLLGHCGPPEVFRSPDGAWHVRDHGRGLRHEHLAQNESQEKLRSDVVIGRFGVGLKDALAVLDGNGVPVVIRTGSADITTATHPKAGFADTATLHAVFGPPSEPGMTGTEVVLTGVDDEVMAQAKGFFLHWSAAEILARTGDGDVLARMEGEPARIYVRGVRVADEEDFLFSYNVRRLNARLAKALNRERANVGRQAYTDRVKSILLASTERAVMSSLADDLSAFEAGTQHTESTWMDIAVHASRVLNASDDVVFVTPAQLSKGGPAFDYARGEGKRLVVVPTKVADKLKGLTDHEGREIRTLEVFRREWSESFAFSWVAPEDLTPAERAVYAHLGAVFGLAGLRPDRWPVLVSETMRPAVGGGGCQAVGLWDPTERRIVIRRDQLADVRRFCGTVLHEVAHAVSGADDASLAFEEALTDVLGRVATTALAD